MADPPNRQPGIDRSIHWVAIKKYLKDIASEVETIKLNSAGFGLQVSLGNVAGYRKINKYGQALDCDSGVETDIWDGADGSTSTDEWVAPTQARVHNLTSASANDASAGTGMRTCQVYGLTDWGSLETSEIVTLDGTNDVATVNEYLIIHRIKGLTFGSTGSNEGIITATAVTDATITAAIQVGEGQTQMAIYGVSSQETIHIAQLRVDALRDSPTGVSANVYLMVKENADQSDSGFVHKEDFQCTDELPINRTYYPIYKSFSGPCIIKLQVVTDADNSMFTGSFDAFVVTNGA